MRLLKLISKLFQVQSTLALVAGTACGHPVFKVICAAIAPVTLHGFIVPRPKNWLQVVNLHFLERQPLAAIRAPSAKLFQNALALILSHFACPPVKASVICFSA